MSRTTTCDIACEILHSTDDGDSLAPEHLKLVEMAVNGSLNEDGQKAFESLHVEVKKGYQKPWLQGVEHLTRDNEGYVYWKGIQVEHWSGLLAYDNQKAKDAAAELARRCIIIEVREDTPTQGNVIWSWNEDQPSPM